jgi:hypothetical protein
MCNFTKNQDADALFHEKPRKNTMPLHNFTKIMTQTQYFAKKQEKSRCRYIISSKNKSRILYLKKNSTALDFW